MKGGFVREPLAGNLVRRRMSSVAAYVEFYNPTLGSSGYTLLHSTVRGEIREPRWRRELYAKTLGEFGDSDGLQGTDVGSDVGRYADQYFTDY